MTFLDWLFIAAYGLGMVFLGWWLGRRQKTSEDYYLAGRRMGWFPVGVSTMATQLSAVSFLSAPAFVGLRPGGGMIWLGYELALPLAMIVLMVLLFPVFHSMGVVSVYEVLERRYDVRVRVAVSLVFQVSRALAAGVMIYAAALVIAVTAGIPLWLTILLTGLIALIYELFGGIEVDIVSDNIQMAVLFIGILVVGAVALEAVGGWRVVMTSIDPARLKAVDFSSMGVGAGQDFGFWPLFIGGFFLYLSYYGADQSQVQRELAARDLDACKASLLFNGLARFPLVLTYCTVGLILGVWASQHPSFLAELPGGNVDYLVPMFIRDRLAPGLTGFIFVAILAAAMSSLDSAINSLSAATLEDVYKKFRPAPMEPRREMRLSRLLTLLWGLFCVGFAFLVGGIAPTILEAINKIGSAFYGPVFAVFLLGLVLHRRSPGAALLGLTVGVLLNLVLWQAVPSVSWLWWNPIGFAAASVPILAAALRSGGEGDRALFTLPTERPPERTVWKRSYLLLGFYTIFLVTLLILLPYLLRASAGI